MNAEQALQIVKAAAELAPLTKVGHINVEQAISVLQDVVKTAMAKDEKKPQKEK